MIGFAGSLLVMLRVVVYIPGCLSLASKASWMNNELFVGTVPVTGSAEIQLAERLILASRQATLQPPAVSLAFIAKTFFPKRI